MPPVAPLRLALPPHPAPLGALNPPVPQTSRRGRQVAQSCCGDGMPAVRRLLPLSLDVGASLCPGALRGQRGAAHPPYPCRVWCGHSTDAGWETPASIKVELGALKCSLLKAGLSDLPSPTRQPPNRLTHQALCPHDAGTIF